MSLKKIISLFALGMFLIAGCVPPGQVKKQSAPGQMKKKSAYNPASGK